MQADIPEGKERKKIPTYILYIASGFCLIFILIGSVMYFINSTGSDGDFNNFVIDCMIFSFLAGIYPVVVAFLSFTNWRRLLPCHIFALVSHVALSAASFGYIAVGRMTPFSHLLSMILGIVEYVMLFIIYGDISRPVTTQYMAPPSYPPPMRIQYQPVPPTQLPPLLPTASR